MSLEMMQENVATPSYRGSMSEEMQREDFLALAAALRRFNVYESGVSLQEMPMRFSMEPRLVLAID